MKAQSFEYRLRNTTPPMPDPEARLRARRLAIAEFERLQSSADKPAPAAPLARIRWWSRHAVVGRFATACVLVIGVSVFWLMPPGKREIPLTVPVSIEPPVKRAAPANETRDVPTVPPREENKEAPARITRGQPSRPGREISAQHVPAPEIPAELRDNLRAPEPADPAEVAVQAAPPPEIDVQMPIALSAPAAPAPSAAAPPPPVAVSSLEELVVTAEKRSVLRNLFTRKASAPVTPAAAIATSPEGRDKFEHFETNPVKRVTHDPVSTFSVDVDTASYSFVRRQLNAGVLPQPDAVRVEEMINYFDYAWPVPESRDEPFKPTVTVTDSPWGEGKKLIHIGIKGYALPRGEQPDVNLVLLMDVSGSMDSPDKLPLAQRSVALLLDSLKPTDTVAIVVYAGAAGQVLAPTPVRDKGAILDALDSLHAGGSTAGAAGIQLAYQLAEKSFRKEGVNRILLATDGDFNVGITDREELKGFVAREREKGVYLSVLGFGEGNYRDEMAQTLAQNGNGVAAYIDTLSEAKKVLVQEATGSLFTIAKDVKLQIEFNPATVAEYRLVGYETRALNREDFNNDKVDAGDVGSGHTVTAIYEITPVGSRAKLIDESRYAEGERSLDERRRGNAKEYGFLKIRYKLPNGFRSRLLQQPILMNAGVPRSLEQDVEFSTAVAGFAQLLRGGKYTGSLSFEDVIREAQGALGTDAHEYRAEFVELVRKAQRARGM